MDNFNSRQAWLRLRDLFSALVELPASDRDMFFDRLKDGHTKQSLGGLLRADSELATFTAQSALQQLVHIGAGLANGSLAADSIGGFAVQRLLGRGGMGTVYLAERAVPGGQQRIALKCLHPIGAAAAFERRFQSEIGVLAQLSHPHIARLIDAGQEADGRCWIAMEFIEGVPLLQYCDEHKLGVEQRLALFDTLCDAVSAAHRSLVVHRDIKSSNVLVRNDGELFLIDFGIARTLSGASDVTLPEQRFLSPLNAAPEQVRGASTTTSCDVYGLGVVLYELLCGMPPLSPQPDESGEAIRKAVLHHVPLLASIRLRQLDRTNGALARRIAGQRACADGARLARQLRGDLEQICAVALRKEPHQRYASVDRLREDLKLARCGLPIVARGNDRFYRATRWMRRHAVALTFATTASVALFAGLAVLWLQAYTLEQERDHARAQTHLAQQQGQRAEFLSGFLLDAFEQADPSHTMGATLTAKQILDAGIGQLHSAEDADPESRIRIAITLADVEYRLGLYVDGDQLVEFSKKHLAQLQAPPARLIAHQHYIEAIRARHENRGLDLIREAEAGLASLGKPSDVSGERLWVGLKRLRADGFFYVDDYAGMLPLYRELVALIEKLEWMKRSDAWDLRTRLAWALEQTEQTRSEARSILAAVLQEQAAAHVDDTPAAALPLALLAAAELHSEDTSLARMHSEKSLALYRKAYGANHPLVARALEWAGEAEAEDGRPKLAIQHYQEGLRILDTRGRRDDMYFAIQYDLGNLYDDVLHEPKTAEPLFRAAIAGFRKELGTEHSATILAECNLAYLFIEQERYAEADPLLQKALRQVSEKMDSLRTPEYISALQAAIAVVRHAQGRDREARELLQPSLASLHWYPMRNRSVMARAHALAKNLHVSSEASASPSSDLTMISAPVRIPQVGFRPPTPR